VRRLLRILLNRASILSLLLGAATAVLWVGSHFATRGTFVVVQNWDVQACVSGRRPGVYANWRNGNVRLPDGETVSWQSITGPPVYPTPPIQNLSKLHNPTYSLRVLRISSPIRMRQGT
jgi:hypothetical protein